MKRVFAKRVAHEGPGLARAGRGIGSEPFAGNVIQYGIGAGGGCLAQAVRELEIGGREPAHGPADEHGVEPGRVAQIDAVFGDQIHDGQVGDGSDFARVVELDFRAGFQAGFAGGFPVGLDTRAGTDRGDRVFADGRLDAAPLNGQMPFADGHEVNGLGEAGDDVGSVAVAAPAPVGDQDGGVRIAAVHALFDDLNHLGENVAVGAVFASLAGCPGAVRRAVGQVFRRRDGIDPGQFRHLAEDMGQGAPHPGAHGGVGGAQGVQVPFLNAGNLGMTGKEGGGHGARLVDVEVDADAESPGALDQFPEVGEPSRMVFAEFRKRVPARRQVPQQALQPHAVDAGLRQARQQSVGVGIQLGGQQRIAVDGHVRIDQPPRVAQRGRRGRRRVAGGHVLDLPYKIEARLGGKRNLVAKHLVNHGADLRGSGACGVIRFLVTDGWTGRFEAAELDPQEVFLAQRKCQALGSHLDELQQLLVGQEMPVSADKGGVPAFLQVGRDRGFRGQSHRYGHRRDVLDRRSEHLGEFCRLYGVPVAPHEGMRGIGEVGERYRRGRVAVRKRRVIRRGPGRTAGECGQRTHDTGERTGHV